jgi:hypothetical protein
MPEHGTRLPSIGVTVFNWSSLRREMKKVDEMIDCCQVITP